MKKRLLFAVATSLLTFTTLGSGTAHAAGDSGSRSCSTTGAEGGMNYSGWTDANEEVFLELWVTDTLADDHHVRVRFISETESGRVKYWSWHKWTEGAGSGRNWFTTAQDSEGLQAIGMQVARFEKDERLNICTRWA